MDSTLPTDRLRPRDKVDEASLRDAGFRWGQRGTHTSRTIMLGELRLVLDNCRPQATRAEYLSAIHEENCLAKRTAATRKISRQIPKMRKVFSINDL